MQLLIEKIKKEGIAIGKDIIKVDSFLNHQVDVELMIEIGKEFAAIFKDKKPDMVLTIEASGILPAAMTAIELNNIPLVFAKKNPPNTMTEGFYSAEVKSFTKGTVSSIRVSEKYLKEGARVLIIDDFLAYGEAAIGLVNLVCNAGATVVGIGAVIEKEFRGGCNKLRNMGYLVESLAVIKEINEGKISFK